MSEYRDELSRCCEMCIQAGVSTGHADTFEALIGEVLLQVDEIRTLLDDYRLADRRD